jgi:DNA-binding CsgD family transcriptional regulator
MALVLTGRTSKEIARLLSVSDLTVRKHRENILHKLGLKSTAQLVALASALTRDGDA